MPRNAASRAIPAPVMPPPRISRSTASVDMATSALARVTWENGASIQPPFELGPAAGPMVGFVSTGRRM